MALAVGTRLGTYEILAPPGAAVNARTDLFAFGVAPSRTPRYRR